MASLLDLGEKLKKLIGGVINTLPPVNAYNTVKQSIPQAQAYIRNNPTSPISTGLAGIQGGIQRLNQAPRIQIKKPQMPNKVGQAIVNTAIAIPESIINIPRNYAVGVSRIGTELGNAYGQKRPINAQNLIGGIAPLTESLVDVGTMGLSTIPKQIIKTSGQQALKSGLKVAIKKGAVTGAKYGGFGGLTYGLDTQYGKEFSPKEVLASIAGGAVLGGVLGGGMASLGGLNKLLGRTPAVEQQLRDKAGRWVAGETPIKPKGMTKPQWEFQLEFNKKYGRNPYAPVYASDLSNAAAYEARQRGGLTVTDVSKDPLTGKPITQATKPEAGVGVKIDPLEALKQEARKMEQVAIKKYGTTEVPESSSFVTHDGTVIDSSGKKLGSASEGRNVDHREIAIDSIPEDISTKGMSGSDALSYFMDKTNATRVNVMPTEINIDTIHNLSDAQLMRLEKLSQGKTIVADISKPDGRVATSGTFKTFAEYRKFIDDFYSQATKPEAGVGVRVPEGTLPKIKANTEAGMLSQSPQGVVKVASSSKSIIPPKTSVASLEREIDKLAGQPPTTGNWKQDYALRQQYIKEIKDYAPPEIVKQIDDLETQIAGLQNMRSATKEPTQNEVLLAEAKQLSKSKQIRQEIQKLSQPARQKITSYLDTLDRQFYQIKKDWENKVQSIGVSPDLKTQAKIKIRDEKARIKLEDQQYKEWQKQVFGEANTRSTTKALDDLAKAVKTSTNDSSFRLNNADNWKNKKLGKPAYTRETMERNFEDIMGSDAPAMKKGILEPIYDANAKIAKFKNKERAEIKALDIKPRSKESELLQLYGEGKIDASSLKSQTPNSDKIIRAEAVLRQKYDSYLTQLNQVLTRNGYDPIPKRKDYFHHFQDLSGVFEQVGVAIKATDLPTDINGLSADFKPGKTFFNAALQRKGDQTSIDAITGIDKYLDGAANQIFQTDNIQRLRAFEKAIREKYAGMDHLSNFVADLTEYTNVLAGKKSMIDRAAEAVVGRKIYAGANALKRQTGANMVGANVSSALTNFIPLTQTLATTDKISVSQAMLGIIKNVFNDDGFIDSSNFLTSRVGSDRLAMTTWEKIGQKGNWLFKVIDNFTSQLVVRSKYLEGIKKGLSETEAMSKANEWGRKTLAGRSAGEMPTLFNSKTMGFLTQFQLEVNNQMSFMAKDIPRNFNKVGAASALAQVFLYSYIYNNLYEKLTGRRPAFDPIGIAQQTYEDYTNPNMKQGQATKNLVKNVGEQLPFTSAITGGRIPVGSAIPNPIAVINGESTIKKELAKPLFYLLPPTGGGQIRKAIEGTKAYNQGASTSDSGRVRYPIPQTMGNRAKTTLFGQYSTPEARTYFREGRNVLGEKQSQTLLNSLDKSAAYQNIMDKRKADNIEATVKAKVESSQKPETSNGYIYYPQGDTIQKISLDWTPPTLELTGQTELDKKLTSSYKSELTSRQTEIKKLYELGQLSADEAEKQIKDINILKTGNKAGSTKKLKKPVKVTIKKTTIPKITISKSKLKALKIKAPPKPKKMTVAKNTIKVKKSIYTIKKPKKIALTIKSKGSIL